MKIVNGWNEQEMQLLSERTKQPLALITRFCEAVDKPLYMMLPEHLRRATLHFHLSPEKNAPLVETKEKESVAKSAKPEKPKKPSTTATRRSLASPLVESAPGAARPATISAKAAKIAEPKDSIKDSTKANQRTSRTKSTPLAEPPTATKPNTNNSVSPSPVSNTMETKKLLQKLMARKPQTETD